MFSAEGMWLLLDAWFDVVACSNRFDDKIPEFCSISVFIFSAGLSLAIDTSSSVRIEYTAKVASVLVFNVDVPGIANRLEPPRKSCVHELSIVHKNVYTFICCLCRKTCTSSVPSHIVYTFVYTMSQCIICTFCMYSLVFVMQYDKKYTIFWEISAYFVHNFYI